MKRVSTRQPERPHRMVLSLSDGEREQLTNAMLAEGHEYLARWCRFTLVKLTEKRYRRSQTSPTTAEALRLEGWNPANAAPRVSRTSKPQASGGDATTGAPATSGAPDYANFNDGSDALTPAVLNARFKAAERANPRRYFATLGLDADGVTKITQEEREARYKEYGLE